MLYQLSYARILAAQSSSFSRNFAMGDAFGQLPTVEPDVLIAGREVDQQSRGED